MTAMLLLLLIAVGCGLGGGPPSEMNTCSPGEREIRLCDPLVATVALLGPALVGVSAVLAAVIGYAARPQRIRFGVIPGYGVLVGGAGVYSVTLQVLDVWRHAATPAAGEGEARTRLAELRYPAGARRQITTGPGRGPPRG